MVRTADNNVIIVLYHLPRHITAVYNGWIMQKYIVPYISHITYTGCKSTVKGRFTGNKLRYPLEKTDACLGSKGDISVPSRVVCVISGGRGGREGGGLLSQGIAGVISLAIGQCGSYIGT